MLIQLRIIKCAIVLLLSSYPLLGLCQNIDSVSKYSPPMIDDSEFYVYFQGANDFPSSLELLNKFIENNLTYPDSARMNGIEGTLYVSFSISTTGKISNIKIDKGSNPYFNSAVIHVISIMPDWVWDKSIKMQSRKSITRTIPIFFNLGKQKKEEE